MIRDFIYFDHDRVMSYGSQLLGGITENIVESHMESDSKVKRTELSGHADVDLEIGSDSSTLLNMLLRKFGKIDVNAGGTISGGRTKEHGDSQSITESKILNHYKFILLRNALIERGLLKNLDSFPENEWHNRKVISTFRPGDFVELSCRVKLFDKGHLESISNSVDGLVQLMQQFEYSESIEKERKSGGDVQKMLEDVNKDPSRVGYDIYRRVLGNEIEPVAFIAMIDLMKSISSGEIASIPMQVIAKPIHSSKKSCCFVAPVRDEFLVDRKEDLLFKYGYEPEQNWKMLCQICNIPKKESAVKLTDFDAKKLKTNAIDEVVTTITDFFMELGKSLGLHSLVKFPDISVNLVALYRE